MGFFLSLAGLLTIGSSYIIRIFISKTGGVEQVGLYTAGFALVETYVGLIFIAMSADFYPRLSAVNENKEEISNLVTQQAVTALLILAPVVVIFVTFIPGIIIILYSSKFAMINLMVRAAMIGMVFRAASFPMGYILYAKGDSRLFIKTSIGFNILFLTNNILGYKFFGLSGLGASFAINFLIHFFALLLITKLKYDFKFKPEFVKIFSISVIICFIAFFITLINFKIVFYILGIFLILISTSFSLFELNKRINLVQTFNSFKSKFIK